MNPRTIPPAIGAVLCCAALLPAAEGANLCFNSGIETAGNNNPPPGWTMWGAQKYKDPANFTRETNNPHAGQACLRIHHPKQTAGYIVSAPDHGVKTEKGQCYAVTFWARAAKAGKSVFGLDGYATIKPLTGAPSPGFFSFDVTPEWKQFTFEVHEGWDFFASKTPFFLLVFKATREEPEEQTLFIDDVAVTAAKSTRDGRLLEREELNVPPLEHRLARGDKLAFAVDTTKKLRRATREAGGISFHRVAGWTGVPYDKQGQYVLPPKLEEAVRDLRLPMTRFYAVGAEQFSLEDGIDKAAALCKRVGIPLETTVLEFETQGATSVLPPDTWASGVRYARERQYGFHRWEITNEPYVGSAKVMFPLPEKYAEHFLAVSKAVRRANTISSCRTGTASWT
jgi:hypothetical protein